MNYKMDPRVNPHTVIIKQPEWKPMDSGLKQIYTHTKMDKNQWHFPLNFTCGHYWSCLLDPVATVLYCTCRLHY